MGYGALPQTPPGEMISPGPPQMGASVSKVKCSRGTKNKTSKEPRREIPPRLFQPLAKVIKGRAAPHTPPAGGAPLHLHVNTLRHLLLPGARGNHPLWQGLGQRPKKSGFVNDLKPARGRLFYCYPAALSCTRWQRGTPVRFAAFASRRLIKKILTCAAATAHLRAGVVMQQSKGALPLHIVIASGALHRNLAGRNDSSFRCRVVALPAVKYFHMRILHSTPCNIFTNICKHIFQLFLCFFPRQRPLAPVQYAGTPSEPASSCGLHTPGHTTNGPAYNSPHNPSGAFSCTEGKTRIFA